MVLIVRDVIVVLAAHPHLKTTNVIVAHVRAVLNVAATGATMVELDIAGVIPVSAAEVATFPQTWA